MLDSIKRLIGAGAAALLLLLLTGHPLASERGDPFISWYPPQVYGAGTQNWAITQGDDGVMYFGNDGVVLTFDGARWEQIKVTPGRAIRSLDRASDGRILVGTQGDFGFLEQTDGGTIEYVSLADELPDDAPAFTDIWQALVDSDRWFFSSRQALFQVENGDIQIHRHDPAQAGGAYLVGGELYVDLIETGLSRLDTDGFQPVSVDPPARHVFAMAPLPDGRILIGSQDDGLLVYAPATETIDAIAPRASEFLADKHLYHGIGLSDGRVALATLRGGVILVDVLADEFEVIDKRSGLPDIRVWHVFVDADDGLWLGMDTGIARIESNSALSRFNSQRGLEGPVLSLIRHNDTLHAGTTLGLFRLIDGYFEPVEGIDSEVWDLATWTVQDGEEQLLAATTFGVYGIQNQAVERISEPYLSTSVLVAPGQPHRLWVGTYDRGLGYMDRLEEDWSQTEFTAHEWPVRRLLAGEDDSLWVETWLDGVWRLDMHDADPLWNYPPADSDEEAAEWTLLATDGHRLVASRNGVWQWHDDGTMHLRNDLMRAMIEPHTGAVQIVESDPGVLWAITTDGITQRVRVADIARPKQKHPLDPLLGRLPDVEFYTLLPDKGETIWISGADGLYRIDTSNRQPIHGDLRLNFRSITTGQGSLPLDNGDNPYLLDEDDFPLTFRFAAAAFDWPEGTRYRYRLPPLQPEWSEWRSPSEHEFSHLPPGSYLFEVQARDIVGRMATVDPFQFEIPPPWYRSNWAVATAVLLIVGIIPLLIWTGGYRQARQNARLEVLVGERTRELQQQKRLLRQQRDRFDHLSRHDELTDLPNRRHGREQLDQAWQAAIDGGKFVSLALIDVDHFKLINDQYGHDVGDQVLVEIAGLLHRTSRPDDVVVRWGGEEFLLLFPGTGLPDAVAICHRISDMMAEHVWPALPSDSKLSVSIGVTATRGQKSVSELLTRADELLYQAKRNGRNRVEVERENW